jgi:hypothetical protein
MHYNSVLKAKGHGEVTFEIVFALFAAVGQRNGGTMQQAPGATMIMVAGILYIVFNALSILMGLAVIGIGVAGSAVFAGHSDSSTATGLILIATITGIAIIVFSAIQLTIGIVAVRMSNKPEKAKTIIVIGYVLVALAVLSFFMNIGSSLIIGNMASTGRDIISFAVGLILPIVLVIGGKKNREFAWAQAQRPNAFAGYGAGQAQYGAYGQPTGYGQPMPTAQQPQYGQPTSPGFSPQTPQVTPPYPSQSPPQNPQDPPFSQYPPQNPLQ